MNIANGAQHITHEHSCGAPNPLAAILKLSISFTPQCHSSLSCINEYLATDSGGYVTEQSSYSNYSVTECFPEKSRWRWNEG